MIQASVQMPRFIRVNSKTTGSFVKLRGKPFQSTQSSQNSTANQRPPPRARRGLIVSQHDNVLVYKPQQASATDPKGGNEPPNAGAVIFLKPEIDRNMLHS